MPRLAIFNMAFGFFTLFLAAAAGAFIATDLTTGFVKDKAFLDSWFMMLSKSAHGHTNLFALLHIAFGLTLPYSVWSLKVKKLQTVGLMLGTLAMGPTMVARAYYGPSEHIDVIEILVGTMLSCALAAIAVQAAGLAGKLLRRS